MTHIAPEASMAPPADIGASEFRFGPEQDIALRRAEGWLKAVRAGRTDQRVFRLFGFAGTGKTTLARHLAADLKGTVCYAAFTGKAALMMQKSGCRDASTIHSLIYTARSKKGRGVEFVLNTNSRARNADLIVIDEISMVDEGLARHLMSFGTPILVLGDPAQLPPVKGRGYFTDARPDAMLTEIHRQARDNPIIRIATAAREGRPIPYGDYGTVVVDKRGRRSPQDALAADQIIVGRNATRAAYNARLRQHMGRSDVLPGPDDRLVCLRNDSKLGLLNGALFRVREVLSPRYPDMTTLSLASEDGMPDVVVDVHRAFFEGGAEHLTRRELARSHQFDYGYALTGHKAQGSQWNHVLAYDESLVFGREARRWLYTVITRAQERLTLIR